jgi:anti-anti-sigma factor
MTRLPPPDAAAPGHLKIQRTTDAKGVVLALTGELDLASVPDAERELLELQGIHPGRVLIDLRGLEFMDSTGLALMIRAQQSAQANGHELSLRRGPGQVHRLFELTQLVDQFTFED